MDPPAADPFRFYHSLATEGRAIPLGCRPRAESKLSTRVFWGPTILAVPLSAPKRRQQTVSSPRANLKVGGAVAQLDRSEEHTSELQSQSNLVCRLLLA